MMSHHSSTKWGGGEGVLIPGETLLLISADSRGASLFKGGAYSREGANSKTYGSQKLRLHPQLLGKQNK